MIANTDNFYMSTKATFKVCSAPDRKADYTSASGSEYWYTNDSVVRRSDHWNCQVNSCFWNLDNGYTGICKLEDFEHMPRNVTVYSKNEIEGFENSKDFIGNYYITFSTNFDNCEKQFVHFRNQKCIFSATQFMHIWV